MISNQPILCFLNCAILFAVVVLEIRLSIMYLWLSWNSLCRQAGFELTEIHLRSKVFATRPSAILFFVGLGIESRALFILSVCYKTELHSLASQPFYPILKQGITM